MPTARQRADHDTIRWIQLAQHRTRRVAQAPGNPVALHRRPHRFRNHQPNPRSGCTDRPRGPLRVHDNVGFDRPHAVLHRRAELHRPRHPVLSRQHVAVRSRCQAVSDRRPLRRRFDTIARPARVRIRSRNPCTRARRRLLGWKVRLPLATAFSSSWHPQARAVSARSRDWTRWPLVSSSSRSLTGAYPGTIPGSLPYRRLSGDCSRVLTHFLGVKLRPNGRPAFTAVTIVTPPRTLFNNPSAMLWNGWPAAPKTVSFCQCRFRSERPRTTKQRCLVGTSRDATAVSTPTTHPS